MVVLNLLHELMHTLGAQHDPEPQCLPPDMVKKVLEIFLNLKLNLSSQHVFSRMQMVDI